MNVNCGTCGICIGIIEAKDEYLKKHMYDIDYDIPGYGCWWFVDGCVSSKDHHQETKFTKSFVHEDYCLRDVVVGMKVNMETKKISYSIDGDDYVDAPIDLERDKYRLAVTLLSTDDEVQLL